MTDLDIVLFGATGFVGKLTAQHLAQAAAADVTIGLAGRSKEKLEQTRASLGPEGARWPLIVADSSDESSIRDMTAQAKVVATTVGPYAKYGLPVVAACAETGTHYCDLTGEPLFVRESADRYHDLAKASGARIAHSCGFDSIPSDLGVLQLHERVRADGEGELQETTLVVEALRGGVSGGTIDSLRGQIDAMRTDAHSRKKALDPYGLSPARDQEPKLGERDRVQIRRDDELGGWIAPFVMAPYNTRIVRRSNALLNWAYGREFRYSEVMRTGRGKLAPVVAGAIGAGVAGLGLGLALPPTRFVLDKVLPKPGEGPSEQARQKGYFRVRIHATTSTGAKYESVVGAQGDPGYAATAVMLGQSAICLAKDGENLPDAAGVLTPATAMGTALVERLRNAGFTIDVQRVG